MKKKLTTPQRIAAEIEEAVQEDANSYCYTEQTLKKEILVDDYGWVKYIAEVRQTRVGFVRDLGTVYCDFEDDEYEAEIQSIHVEMLHSSEGRELPNLTAKVNQLLP